MREAASPPVLNSRLAPAETALAPPFMASFGAPASTAPQSMASIRGPSATVIEDGIAAKQALRMQRFLLTLTASAGVLIALIVCHVGGVMASQPFWLASSLVVGVNLVFYGLFRSGLNLRAQDPSLTIYQMLAASATIFFVVYNAGLARHVFLLVILVILVFGVFRLNRWQMGAVVGFDLLAYATEIGLNLIVAPGRINVHLEIAQWVVMGGALHLFAIVTGQVSALRKSVEDRNHDLAAAVASLEQKQKELARTEELAMLGSWALDISSDAVTWSDQTFRLFGLNPAAGTPKLAALRKQLHADDRARFLAVTDQSKRDGTEFSIEFRVWRADDAVRWMTMNGFADMDASGAVLRQYGTIMDITVEMQGQLRLQMQHDITRVLAEAPALKEAVPRVLQIFGNSLEWACGACWRIAPDGASLRCVDIWSDPNVSAGGFAAAMQETRLAFPVNGGFLREAWVTMRPVWRADVTQDEKYGRRAAARAAGVRGAFALPVVSNGEVLRVIEFYSVDAREPDAPLIDLAASLGNQLGQFIERRTTEVALQQSQERLDVALRGSGVGLWENNLVTGLLYCSPRVAELLDYNPEEMPRSWAAMALRAHADDLKPLSARVLQAVKTGGIFSAECRFLTASGEHHWFLLRGQAFLGANQRAEKIAGSMADIEDRKRLERAKDEFVATVSHELRTPLTAIRGALGLLKGGVAGELPPEALELTSVALSGSERLGRLVNDILDVARVESGAVDFDFEVLPVETVLRDALTANQTYAQQFQVHLVSRCELPEAAVRVDPDRIAQVMANLISNAAKFSSAGAVVEVVAAEAGRWVRISVIDYGRGIPAEFRARIFQKFAQADGADNRQREGTGLGLSICRALVEEMNGMIDFTDTPGGGATFYIELPLAAAEVLPVAVPPSSSAPGSSAAASPAPSPAPLPATAARAG